MTLKRIELYNFLSHQKSEIDFLQDQNVLIDGVSGSGKSSIIEAITWVLYGVARSDNKSLIRRGSTTARVVIIFSDDKKNIEYKLERIINNKGKHELTLLVKDSESKQYKPALVTGIKNTQDYIEKDILKSSYLLFVNSIIHLQENIDSFVKQTATKRKDILLEIINASSYDEYLKKTKEKLQSLKTNIAVSSSRIETLSKNITFNTLESVNLETYRKIDNDIKIKIEQSNQSRIIIENKIKSLEKSLILLESYNKELIDLKDKRLSVNLKITEINNKINELQKIDLELVKNKVREIETMELEILELEKQQSNVLVWNQKHVELLRSKKTEIDYSVIINNINKEMIGVMSKKIDECPELGKICPILKKDVDSRINTLNSDLNTATEDRKAQDSYLEEYRQKIISIGEEPTDQSANISQLKLKIRDLEHFRTQLSEMSNTQDRKNELLVNLSELLKEAEKLDTSVLNKELEIDAFKESENDLGVCNNKLSELISEIQSMTSSMLENHSKLIRSEIAAKKLEEDNEELKIEKEKIGNTNVDIDNLELLKDAFGPNGVKSIVIDHVIPQLEDRINNILNRLSDFNIRLETQKNGIGKDVLLEGLFITIINGEGQELDYQSLSGGEKIKVTMSISEALSEVQNIHFRIMDEAFIGLDEDSIDSFARVTVTLQERFKQMICISHLRSIKDLFEQRVLVKKINGISEIVK